ncbi:nuclear transport factor 2 family protein [Polymorphobacter arshaanensis]|uniref:Nuclear transport factor 2 family protein n=1 Tax=Glacieibacterium arshaanense TaxID=2511025 RepID=A0A4Y9ETJ8_9SPHN|nr:SgcJ/EcaC family oxidoreductase [Polymorphobacter arshaanensis]TFU06238.1 nuclear transport factor 2 family protein [Polymorphobacter arshaanensis]
MSFVLKSATAAALIALVVLAGCDKQPNPPKVGEAEAIATQIRLDEARWQADWKARDAQKLAAHYTDDAVVMIPGRAVAKGSTEIAGAIAGALTDPQFTLVFASDAISVAASGDLAVSRGRYIETDSDPVTKAPLTTRGSYVTVYKPQADGKWRAVWDINTPSAQPSDAALVEAVDVPAAPLAAPSPAPKTSAVTAPAPSSADRL